MAKNPFMSAYLSAANRAANTVTALVEVPQGCSSKFPTLWRGQRSVPGWVPARILSVRAWWSRSL